MLLRRLSVLTVFVTFCLLLAGGLVHSTGSGLACPDWPLCHGQFFPSMTGGVEFEHSHRLLAAAVTFLTVTLMILLWRRRSTSPRLARLAVTAFALVLFQAGLGALTVIYKLPMLVKTAHLATSMLFFSLTLALSFHLYEDSFAPTGDERKNFPDFSRLIPWINTTLFFVYLQIVLGAFVRHTGAGGVCPTILLCEESLWPVGAHPAIQLHMAHRWMAILVGILVVATSMRSYRLSRSIAAPRLMSWLRLLASAAPLLVIVQILLGVASVATNLALPTVMLHLSFGALLLGNFVLLSLTLSFAQRETPFAAERRAGVPSLASDILSLTKARLSSFVLVVTTISFALGAYRQENFLGQILWLLLGMSLLAAGASLLNCYFERDIDAQMERTRSRPLAAGRLRPNAVLYVGALSGLIAVALLTLTMNPLTGFLGAVAFITYAFVYTPLKAKTSLAALVGAIPGSLPPLIGWTAASGKIDGIGITLFFILFFWQLPHFFAIAIYRQDEYGKAGLQVLPLTQGEDLTKKMMFRYTLMLIPVSLFLFPLGVAGPVYFYTALTLGLIYAGLSLSGLRAPAIKPWARLVFLYSLVYLPLLFITLFLDRAV